MKLAPLQRRKFLQLSFWMGIGALTSCGRQASAYLMATKETLPKPWLKELPTPWEFKSLKVGEQKNPYRNSDANLADLIGIGGGWLNSFTAKDLKEIDDDELISNFNSQSKLFIGLQEESLRKCLLPVGVSPWVMLFRNGDPWLTEAKKTWDVLLDPRLQEQIVFPRSPRLIMSIADQIGNGNDLKQLRLQALTLDDQNATNWVLSGKAKVALLPMQRCLKNLRRDPRLQIALPREGAPLHWTIFIRPKNSFKPLPKSWIKESWNQPLMGKLLSEGWIPPLKHSAIKKNLEKNDQSYYYKFLPQEEAWSNCWSLGDLDTFNQEKLGLRWEDSTP